MAKLKQGIWENESYYHSAKEGSLDVNHPGMKILKKLSLDAKNILDLGCGEGTRLNSLLTQNQQGTGVDISQKALEMGETKYHKITFIKADLRRIPLPDNDFDLIYSAYVFEHLADPIKVLKEGMRLLAPEGKLVIIAPNYGAPNRASPPFKGSRIKKLICGIVGDFKNLVVADGLNWKRVEPIAEKNKYEMDWDTTVEPYLGNLINYVKSLNLKTIYYTSCWSQEFPHAKIYQKLIRKLGELGVYPFSLWGPHLVMIAKK